MGKVELEPAKDRTVSLADSAVLDPSKLSTDLDRSSCLEGAIGTVSWVKRRRQGRERIRARSGTNATEAMRPGPTKGPWFLMAVQTVLGARATLRRESMAWLEGSLRDGSLRPTKSDDLPGSALRQSEQSFYLLSEVIDMRRTISHAE